MLSYINRKPRLNGAVAEVLGDAPDEQGLLLVRVPKEVDDASKGWKKLKVLPRCLKPLDATHHEIKALRRASLMAPPDDLSIITNLSRSQDSGISNKSRTSYGHSVDD